MEQEELENYSDENLQKEKQQKSRNRVFGLIVVIDVILLAFIVWEIVQLVAR